MRNMSESCKSSLIAAVTLACVQDEATRRDLGHEVVIGPLMTEGEGLGACEGVLIVWVTVLDCLRGLVVVVLAMVAVVGLVVVVELEGASVGGMVVAVITGEEKLDWGSSSSDESGDGAGGGGIVLE